MENSIKNFLKGNYLDFELLMEGLQKPEPFAPGEELFWNDPHISKGMLEAHLNPCTDAASRRPETIEKAVNHLINAMKLKPGDKILDLGCGPGLYSRQFAQIGFEVTGVDYSARSLEFAVQDAERLNLNIRYEFRNYLDIDFSCEFDAVLLIYGDVCVLSDADRDGLLGKICKALKPDGRFAFDVTTRGHREKNGVKNGWYAVRSGFWKPGPHLVLEMGFDYPEINLYLDQYFVLEESGRISTYRNWFHDYSRDEIARVLDNHGFAVEDVWSDLAGEPYREGGEWIGLVAGKKSVLCQPNG